VTPALVLAGLGATLALMFLAWALSLALRNTGIVDVFWGLAIAGAGVAWVLVAPQDAPRGALAATLAVVWALRLGGHILWRGWGRPEDRRYREIRARNEPGFAVKSLYLVFGLQAVLAWLVAFPLYGAAVSTAPLGALDYAGVALWVFGFGYEAIADAQLAGFQRRGGAERGVMQAGLWRYSRHPNYFFEWLAWCGIATFAWPAAAAYALAQPIAMFLLVRFVSGVPFTELQAAKSRGDDYRRYQRETNAFFPWFPRRGADA
jgi:steroid 5-alpha reductase family enzyme